MEGQLPGSIPAQGNALGLVPKGPQGLKARTRSATVESSLQPWAHRGPVPGALLQAGIGVRHWRSGDAGVVYGSTGHSSTQIGIPTHDIRLR